MKNLVAIPCFNEEDNINQCIDSLLELKSNDDNNFDISVVNDGSKDQTDTKLSQYGDKLSIIFSKQNYGLSEVFNSILFYSKQNNYDGLLIFDSDNQYPYEDIPELFNKLMLENLDIVIGSRDFSSLDHFSKSKKFFQKLGSLIVGLSLRLSLTDVTSGFRAYSSKAMNTLFVSNTFTYTLETLYQAKQNKLKISYHNISYTNETRDSRLFDSNFEYITKSIKIIFKSMLIYRSKLMMSLIAVLFSIPGFALTSRFFIKYFQYGENSGNIQSLVVGVAYFNFLLIIFIFIYMVLNGYKNKVFFLRNLYQPKHN